MILKVNFFSTININLTYYSKLGKYILNFRIIFNYKLILFISIIDKSYNNLLNKLLQYNTNKEFSKHSVDFFLNL